MKRRRWIALLWSLTGLVVLLLLVKFFVADVYRVDSGSMRPTIFGGRDRADDEEDAEHVLVHYGRGLEPERFDLVVIRSPDGSKPLVKRVCGLPGEDLMIRDGDLFVGRERLPADAARPAPVPVYDDRYLEPERFFEHARDGSVRREGSEWIVDGASRPPGTLLFYRQPLRDDYLDLDHRRVPGIVEVNDAVLELGFCIDAPLASQMLRFQLVEESDTFEVVLAAGAGSTGSARLVRRNQDTLNGKPEPGSDVLPAGQLTLAEQAIELVPERWHHLSFSNVDNHLRVRCAELGLDLSATYKENQHWNGQLPAGQKTIFHRVRFGAESGRARFRDVRILRDFYYTDDGTFAVRSQHAGPGQDPAAPTSLGPDEYFLLGDNSAASTDSRHFGPIKAARLLGEPLAVVWPRPRWLRPTVPP